MPESRSDCAPKGNGSATKHPRIREGFWTIERVDLLASLAKEELTGRQIAEALGDDCTRNMVVNKLRRLHIPLAGSVFEKRSAASKAAHARKKAKPPRLPAKPLPPTPPNEPPSLAIPFGSMKPTTAATSLAIRRLTHLFAGISANHTQHTANFMMLSLPAVTLPCPRWRHERAS